MAEDPSQFPDYLEPTAPDIRGAQDRLQRIQGLWNSWDQERQVQTVMRDGMTRRIGDAAATALGFNRDISGLVNSNNPYQAFAGNAILGLSRMAQRYIPGQGDPMSIYAGFEQAIASGGFRMGGMDSYRIGGFSPLSSAFAAQFTGQALDRIFPGGISTVPGMSRDDLGSVINELQRRGTFNGMEIASSRLVTSDWLIQQRAASAGNPAMMRELEGLQLGDTRIEPNMMTAQKITEAAQSAIKGLGWLKTVLGNVPWSQLMSEAESLTGMRINTPGSISDISSSLRQTVLTGAQFGLNPLGMLNFRGATISSLDASMASYMGGMPGSFRPFAGAMAPILDSLALSAHMERQNFATGMAEQGRFVNMPTAAETAAMTASNAARVLSEEREAVAAGWVASNGANARQASQLRALIGSLGSAGTEEQRRGIRSQLSSVITSAGFDAYNLYDMVGPESLLNGASMADKQLLGRMAVYQDQSRNINLLSDYFGSVLTGSQNYAGALGGAANAAGFAMNLMQLTPGQLAQAQQIAAQAGSPDAIRQQLTAFFGTVPLPPGLSASDLANQVAYAQQRIAGMGGGRGVGDFISQVQAARSVVPGLANQMSYAGMAETAAGYTQAAYSDRLFGAGAETGFIQQVVEGFFGAPQRHDDADYIRYLQNRKGGGGTQVFSLDASGRMDTSKMTDADIQKLVDWTTKGNGLSLFEKYGIDRSAKDKISQLRKALGGENGGLGVMDFLRENPDAISVGAANAGGGIDITVGDPAARAELERDIARSKGQGASKTRKSLSDTIKGFVDQILDFVKDPEDEASGKKKTADATDATAKKLSGVGKEVFISGISPGAAAAIVAASQKPNTAPI